MDNSKVFDFQKKLTIFILSGFTILALLFSPLSVEASTDQFVTIVNPVRISKYTADVVENVRIQHEIIRANDLSATWLLRYDALNENNLQSLMRTFDSGQELGLFVEITQELCDSVGITYNDTGFWHHATSLFLSGYKQPERIKMIDKMFERFKEIYGYYPKSVGSWWTDSFSLQYMQEKYGVAANLTVADQFSTDGYQVWGQYFSSPFYPSKIHAGVPASTKENKLDVVNLQWAPRDPLNGYYNSYYSTQDYKNSGIDLTTGYFEKLVRLYANKNENEFGHIVVGLESDLAPDAYNGEFKNQINYIKKLSQESEHKVLTMGEFSEWYLKKYPDISPEYFIQTNDLLDKPDTKKDRA